MADHFLTKTRVAQADFVEAGGRPVLERHDELRGLLADRAGPGAAALFAEPLISRGNDSAPPTVAWYGDSGGEARPLSALPAAERDRAEAYLADHLRPLRALAADPGTADLVLGALSVLGGDDVMVADGRPVIVNWGLLPGGNGANAAARPAHYEATMGRYLPLAGAVGEAPRPTPVTPLARAGGPAVAPAADVAPRALTPLAWVPLLVLLVLAALVLAWLLLPGTRLMNAATPPAVSEADALAAQRALNDSLRARRDALQAALDGAVCRADGVLVLPGGLTPEGLTPPPPGIAPEPRAPAAPDALLPNRADRVLVPQDEGADTSLLNWIEARTVLVLARGGEGVTVGSGFVVAPGRVLTNQHVIAGAQTVLVAARSLARPLEAQVVKADGPLAETGGDFALLGIEDTGLPAFPLFNPSGSLKLQQVIAAGFPGDVLEMDAGFAALTSGDTGAMPDLTVTDGIINTEQRIGPETRVLMHSAPLSTGNSGGPLVDMCGRVVGINSFVRQGRLQNRGYALPVPGILAFLDGTGSEPQLAGEDCAPMVSRAAPDATAPEAPARD
ncbi:MAG: trypsin-like peptidase domain-containing protein [Jhaorihella sp.]